MYFDTNELAKMLHLDKQTIYKAVNNGELRAIRQGCKYIFDEKDVEAYLSRKKTDYSVAGKAYSVDEIMAAIERTQPTPEQLAELAGIKLAPGEEATKENISKHIAGATLSTLSIEILSRYFGINLVTASTEATPHLAKILWLEE